MTGNRRKILCVAGILALALIAGLVSGCSLPEDWFGAKLMNGLEDWMRDDLATPTPEAPLLVDISAPTAAPTAMPTEEPIRVTVTRRMNDACVKAVPTGTFGLANDGSVRFIGDPVSGQNYIYDWSNVVRIAANSGHVAALLRSGSMLLSGPEGSRVFDAALDWTGITEIAMGEKHLVGLRADGTLIAVGDNSSFQTSVDLWKGVTRIEAAGNYTAAISSQGVVTTLGDHFSELINAKTVVDIAAAPKRLAVLDSDGRVRVFSTVKGQLSESTPETVARWRNIVKVFVTDEAVYAVSGEGKLFTDSELIDRPVSDVYYVSATSTHAVVLHGDGTCEGFGDNSLMQTGVEGWRLLPYVTEEGWLLGMNPGTYIAGEPIATGRGLVWTDPATGRESSAVCVILGDVNGDGAIDSADLSAVEAHIDGAAPLEGAFLRAANIIADEAAPESIDVNDVDALKDQLSGRGVIDQYAKTDEYTALLCQARRENPDALGYITIDGTNISYPIMYGQDWFYNDHGFDKQELTRGCIYYYWNTPSRNIVITGHNSRPSGLMFHQLHFVQDRKEELSDYRNRLWYINNFGQSGYWEVWAMYEEPAFDKAEDSSQNYNTCWPDGFAFLDEEQRQAWIEYQLERSELDYSVSVTTKDRFVTILTCGDDHSDSSKGARLYFFLRWVGKN